MPRKRNTIIGIIIGLMFAGGITYGQTGVGTMDQWKSDGTNITQRVANTAIKITGLTTGLCLSLNGSNILTTTACGSGGGGSGGGTWATTTSQVAGRLINYPINTTDIVTIGSNSTTTANYYIDPNINRAFFLNASTTNTSATTFFAGIGSVSAPSVWVNGAGGLYKRNTNEIGLTNGVSSVGWDGTSFVPGTTDARDLGSIGNRWDEMFGSFLRITTSGGTATTTLFNDSTGHLVIKSSTTTKDLTQLSVIAPDANPLEADITAIITPPEGGSRIWEFDNQDNAQRQVNLTESVSGAATFAPWMFQMCKSGACVPGYSFDPSGAQAIGVTASSLLDKGALLQLASSTATRLLEVDSTRNDHKFTVYQDGITMNVSSTTITGLKNCDTIDTDATGKLSCGTDGGGGGGTPGGSTTQLQFNDASAFAGAKYLTWDKTNYLLALNAAPNSLSAAFTVGATSTLGADVITNGTFTGSAAGWFVGDNAEYLSNAASSTYMGGDPLLTQDIPMVSGNIYTLTYTLSNVIGGVCIYFDNTSFDDGCNGAQGNGTYTFTFSGDYTGTDTLWFEDYGYAIGDHFTLDNVSLIPRTPHPTIVGLDSTGANEFILGSHDGYSFFLNGDMQFGSTTDHYIDMGTPTATTTSPSRLSIRSGSPYDDGSSPENGADLRLYGGTAVHGGTNGKVCVGGSYGCFKQSGNSSTIWSFPTTGAAATLAVWDSNHFLMSDDGIAMGHWWSSQPSSIYMGYLAGTLGDSGNNTGIGNSALHDSAVGYQNTAVGSLAMVSPMTGSDNTAIGMNSMNGGGNTNSGTVNTAVGAASMYFIADGHDNTAIGVEALDFGTSEVGNVAIGNYALLFATSSAASYNVAVGMQAMESSNTNFAGTYNVAVGAFAASSITTGVHNTVLGGAAGSALITGNQNTIVGFGAGGVSTGEYNIVIGANTTVPSQTDTGQMNIGNILYAASIDTPSPKFGVGSTTPWARLSIKGIGTTGGTALQLTDSNNVPKFTILDNGLTTIAAGFISQASSTIGGGTQTGGLTVSGGATTTGNAYFLSPVGINGVSNRGAFGGNGIITVNGDASNSAIQEFFRPISSGASNVYTMTFGDTSNSVLGQINGRTDTSGSTGVLQFMTSNGSSDLERMRITSQGMVGIATTTPFWNLTVASSTGAQLALLDGSNSSNAWTFRSIANSFYISTSSNASSATSTTAALAIDPNGRVTVTEIQSGVGAVGTPSIRVSTDGGGLYRAGASTLGLTNGSAGISWNGNALYPNTNSTRDLGIVAANVWNRIYVNFASTTGITTSYASTSKFFADGLVTCSGGNTLSWDQGAFGCQLPGVGSSKWATSTDNTSIYPNFATKVGIGTTTPWGQFSLKNTGSFPTFATDSNGVPFIIDSTGKVGIATTTNLNTTIKVNGQVEETWGHADCSTGSLVADLTANTSSVCGSMYFAIDGTGRLQRTTSGGASIQANGLAAGAGLGGAAAAGSGSMLASSYYGTFAANNMMGCSTVRIGEMQNSSSTVFRVGFMTTTIAGDTTANPTQGIWFEASSTAATGDWYVVTRNAGGTVYQATGIASTTVATGDTGSYRMLCINGTAGTSATFNIYTGFGSTASFSSTTSMLPASSVAYFNHFSKVVAGLTPRFDIMMSDLWWKPTW